MRVGIAGIGRMGSAIAVRLLARGHEVTVWNRSPAKAQPISDAGARVAPTARELAAGVDIVLTVLTDASAIQATYRDSHGLLASDVRGKLFIDMSTVRPQVARALASEVRDKGAVFVECPVGGTVGPAREGRLFGFAGGDDKDVARALPLLGELCRRIEHVGPVGAGASMKLAINLPLLVYYEALGEALALCRSLDVDPARLIEIFADTSGGPNVLKVRGATIAASLRGEEAAAVTFNVDMARKDLRTMLDEAASLGVELPLVAKALERFDAAAHDGLGARDASFLPAYMRRISGVKD